MLDTLLRAFIRRLIPRGRGPVGYTEHAVERFLERAVVQGTHAHARDELRDLARAHGQIVRHAPTWAQLKPAPCFLVVGDWLCLPLRPSRRTCGWDATTLVCREGSTWTEARRRGWIAATPTHVRHRQVSRS